MSREQFFVWFTANFDGPFAVLILMLLGLGMTLWLADVNVGQMFKDEQERADAHQFVVFGSWAFGSTYLLADLQANKHGSGVLFALYLVAFAGSAAFVQAIAKWDGSTPWSNKPPTTPPAP
jgi:thiol:disulfide interchange protein